MSPLRRLVGLLGPHRRWIVLGVLLGFLAIGANVALMATSAYLISRAAIVTNVADVALAITAVRVLAIGRAAFRYLERYVTHLATFRVLADLRAWFFRSIEPLAPARLSAHRSGDLLARIVADIGSLEDAYVRVLLPPVVAALVTAFTCALLGLFDPALAVVLLVFVVLAGVVIPLLVRRASRAPATAVIATRGELGARLVDEISGVADLIVLDQAAIHRERTLAVGREMDRLRQRLALLRGAGTALAGLAATLAGVAILALAIPLVNDGRIDAVVLALLPLAAIASFEAVQPLSASVELLDTDAAAADRLFSLIDASPPVVDPTAASPDPTDHGIVVAGLRFRYDAGGSAVLDGLDLDLPAGTSLAIVGSSGAGKSTLVNLLLRFWDYDEGAIRIGGHDLHAYAADDVRAMLGVVAQDVHLFDATIRDNLALADRDLTDERMVGACRMALAHDFIAALPDGYDTRIGENGLRLSGGERQRVAIARAIIRDAPILVLDEATANLDAETERRLMASLAPFIASRTALLITHRAAVAERADRVVRLAGGRAIPA